MFRDNKDFYPTPKALSGKMLAKVRFAKDMKVLEPSAGKGDLAKQLKNAYKEKVKVHRFDKLPPLNLDVIEKDQNLQNILKGAGYRLVADDFLRFKTEKWYDLIVMNPPFSEGVKHVLKAIEMINKGGQLVALLNATNIKNPNNVYEKDLVRKIQDYGAEVEFLEEEFATSEAERKTNVEVALIYFEVKPKRKKSVIVEKLKKDIEVEKANEKLEDEDDLYAVVTSDMVQSIVEQYQFEIKAGLRVIDEFYSAKKHFLRDFSDNSGSILNLKLTSCNDNYASPTRKALRNNYIKEVRAKYWNTLFKSREFESLFTSRVRDDYRNQVSKLVEYDFSVFNILQIQEDLSKVVFSSIEESILELFDEFSHKHYYNESSKNVYLYNGWKTNKSWKVNKRVIIPLNAYSSWNGNLDYDYKVRDKMNDLEKALSYLDSKPYNPEMIEKALKETKINKLETEYYSVIFYKKGTAHITFKSDELLKRFNIIGSMLRGWLPPSYGEKEFRDMTTEEQDVISSFEGKDSYAKVLANKEYYLERPGNRKIELPSEALMKLEYKAEELDDVVVTAMVDETTSVEPIVVQGSNVGVIEEPVVLEGSIDQTNEVQNSDVTYIIGTPTSTKEVELLSNVVIEVNPNAELASTNTTVTAATMNVVPEPIIEGIATEVITPVATNSSSVITTDVVFVADENVKQLNEQVVEDEVNEIDTTPSTLAIKPHIKKELVTDLPTEDIVVEKDIDKTETIRCEVEQMSLF